MKGTSTVAAAVRASNRFERRRERTRQELLAAATRVLAEKGLDRTKVTDIAAAADVGVGTFYLHFPDKEALFDAVVEETVRRLKAPWTLRARRPGGRSRRSRPPTAPSSASRATTARSSRSSSGTRRPTTISSAAPRPSSSPTSRRRSAKGSRAAPSPHSRPRWWRRRWWAWRRR